MGNHAPVIITPNRLAAYNTKPSNQLLLIILSFGSD